MIPDDLAQKVLRLHHVEKWKPGTIARELGLHHSTVRRVLSDQGLAAPPERPSMVEPYLAFIVETLKTYPKLPASRLYQMVVERGYPGRPDHFRSIVARLRPRKPAEAFLRLRTLPGEEAQADWGHFGTMRVGGAVRPLYAFVMVLSWSRKLFVHFFHDLRMGSFLDGHVRAFEAFEGAPRRVLYDNLKSAVLERRGDAIRFHPTLLELAAHYRFEPRPVAVARGNEKGRVERAIRYLRTSFWPGRTFRDLADLHEQLARWGAEVADQRQHPDDRTLTPASAHALERDRLVALPHDPFPAAERVDVRVGKQPYVRFDLNDYSVRHDHVRRTVTVWATTEIVHVVDGDEVIAEHRRTFDRDQVVEDPTHIAALVEAKREGRDGRGQDRLHHAAPASEAFLIRAAERGHNLGAAVAGLLRLLDTWGADALQRALIEAYDADLGHVHAVAQVLERRHQLEGRPPPLPVELPDDPRVRDLHVTPHALATYDLTGGDDGPL